MSALSPSRVRVFRECGGIYLPLAVSRSCCLSAHTRTYKTEWPKANTPKRGQFNGNAEADLARIHQTPFREARPKSPEPNEPNARNSLPRGAAGTPIRPKPKSRRGPTTDPANAVLPLNLSNTP